MKSLSLLLSFCLIVISIPLLAQNQSVEQNTLQELRIKIELEKKFTKSVSDLVNQYHQKYYDYRITDFSNVENRTEKYIAKVNQARATQSASLEQLIAEHNYWRAKRQELTAKLAYYQGEDVSFLDEWYNDMKSDVLYIVKNIDWKTVFKPILECFSDMNMDKCSDIQGVIKNLVIESIEKTWKKNFIDKLVSEMKVTPEIASNVWDSYVIVKLDKTPWQELIEKGKDKLSEEGEKKLTEYLSDKVIAQIDVKMLKGKTKEEATKYMKDQATNAAETRAKDLFSSVTFASDMFWKFADIFSGLNLVEQVKPTLVSRMAMVREAAECSNITNKNCSDKLNFYYLNNKVLRNKLKELKGKNVAFNIPPKVGQVLNPNSKDDEIISATNNKLDHLKENAKASFNLDAFISEQENLKANFDHGTVWYNNYLTTSSRIVFDADSTFSAWTIAQKIKPKKAGRIKEKIEKWKNGIKEDNIILAKQYTEFKLPLLTEQNQIGGNFRQAKMDATKISNLIQLGLKSLDEEANNADLNSFNNQKSQILNDLDSIGTLISQCKKLPFDFISKIKKLACSGTLPNYFWNDGEWETSVVNDVFCGLHISLLMNRTGCGGSELIIPDQLIEYPTINPAEIYQGIEDAEMKLNQNMTLKLVGRNEAVWQPGGGTTKPAFESKEQKEVLKALNSTIYMQAANDNMEELKERMEITLSQLEHLASRLGDSKAKINGLNAEQKSASFGTQISHDEIALGLGILSPEDFKTDAKKIVDEYFNFKITLLNSAEDLQEFYQNETLISLVETEIDRLDSRGGFYVNSSNKFKLVNRWLDVKEELKQSVVPLKTALDNFLFVDKNKIIWKSFSTIQPGYTALEEYCKTNNFPDDFLDMNWLDIERSIYGSSFEVKTTPPYNWLTPKQYRRLQNKENYERYSFARHFSDLFLTTQGNEPVNVEELINREKEAKNFILMFVTFYNNNQKQIPDCETIKNLSKQLNELEKGFDESLYLKVKEEANTVIDPLNLLCGKYSFHGQTVQFFTHLLPQCEWYDVWKRYRALQVPGMEYEIELNGIPVKELQKQWADRNSLKIIGTDPELTISNGKFSERLKNDIVSVELKVCEVPAPDANENERYNYQNCISNEMFEIVASGIGTFSKKYKMKPQGLVRIYLRIKVKDKNGESYFEPYPDGIFVQWWDETIQETPTVSATEKGTVTLEIFSGEGSFQDGYDFQKQAVQRIGENGVSDASLNPDIFYSEKEFIESPDTYVRPKVIDFGEVPLSTIMEKPAPDDHRFYPIEFHKSPITKGHTYAMYTKSGNLVFLEIIDMYKKSYADDYINGITFKWKIPSSENPASANLVNTSNSKNNNSNIGENQNSNNTNNQLNIASVNNKIPFAELKKMAYEKYMVAYNILDEIMGQGNGDTPEAQVAYKDYKEKKDYYDSLINGTSNISVTNQNNVNNTANITNALPVASLNVTTVSGGPFQAPVWVQFDPSGSYDPDGQITLFELDKDGDNVFEIRENSLHGASMEFTTPGNYTSTLRVTDNNGQARSISKLITITGPTQVNNQSGKFMLDNSVWQPHKTSEGNYSKNPGELCVESMKPGGAWFTTPRPYNFENDYQVFFDVKLNAPDNHFPILYSDGFVFVDIDWGTVLGHVQPGATYGLKSGLGNLEVGKWYQIRVDAHPTKNSFDLYLNNELKSTATNISYPLELHTFSKQINNENCIWLGDADDVTFRGGNYNKGAVCWRNIIVKQTGSLVGNAKNGLPSGTKTEKGNLPFYEDFSAGTGNWSIEDPNARVNNGQLFWNTGNSRLAVLNKQIPMENVAIEFDGFCETNGINVYLHNNNDEGYIVFIGGWYNTQSGSDVGKVAENREVVHGKVWVPKQWHHYKVVRNENTLETYCDGRKIYERNVTSRFPGTGKLMFNSYAARIGIDNVKIYRTQKDDNLQHSPAGSLVWQETAVPWVKVWAAKGATLETKEIDGKNILSDDFKSISSYVSIEPQGDNAVPGAVRVTMPKTVQISPEDRGRVVLAFYEESYSPCTGEVESRWRFHTADYNAQTNSWEAELNHGCIITWGLVTLGGLVSYAAWDDISRWLMTKKASDHFVLHYKRDKISEETVTSTLNKLEDAQTFLTGNLTRGGLGLEYPSVPAKLDVYYLDIKSTKEVIYGLYQQGKTGARWMDLNLPSSIPNYDSNTLKATLTHELFHFIQFPYEGYSTFKDAWWRKGKQMVVSGNNFPYGWLNEALSSSVELTAVKTFVPNNKSPILDNDLLIKGLKGLSAAKEGYSAGLFIDFLVHRYGVAIYPAILNECKRQIESGTLRDPVVAIQRAVVRLARQQQPANKDWQNMDAVWQSFTDAFIREKPDPPLMDKRLDRRIPFTTPPVFNLTIQEDELEQKWTIEVPPLSLKPLASKIFNITPAKWNDEDKAIVQCKVKFMPDEAMSFDISTSLNMATSIGKKAFLPIAAVPIGKVNRNETDLPFTLTLEKKNRRNYLSFIPTGLGATTTSRGAKGSYLLTCKLHKEETISAPPPIPVSTNAIDAYWWIFWQTAVTMKASKRSYNDIQPERCEELYASAEEEWSRISGQIAALRKQKDDVEKEMQPLLDFFDNNDISSVYRQAGDVIDFLMEINNNYGDAIDPCGDAFTNSGYSFVDLSIDWGRRVVVPFTFLINSQSRIMNKLTLPTKEEMQRALDKFHKNLSQLKPCQSGLEEYADYWERHKVEAFQKLDELKTKIPSLK